MKTMAAMQADQIEKLARFLEEHHGFSSLLETADAVVFGFQVGDCYLTLGEMEKLIAAQPHFDSQQVALLLSLAPTTPERRLP